MISLLCDELRRYAFLSQMSLMNRCRHGIGHMGHMPHMRHMTHRLSSAGTDLAAYSRDSIQQGAEFSRVGCADMESQMCEASCEQDLCITKKEG